MNDSFQLPPCVGDNKPSLGSYVDPLAFARTTFSPREGIHSTAYGTCVSRSARSCARVHFGKAYVDPFAVARTTFSQREGIHSTATELVCHGPIGAAHVSTLGRYTLIRLQLHGQRSLKENESH